MFEVFGGDNRGQFLIPGPGVVVHMNGCVPDEEVCEDPGPDGEVGVEQGQQGQRIRDLT